MTSSHRFLVPLGALCLSALPGLCAADTVQGVLAWSGLSRVSLPVSGVIQNIPVTAGQTVTEGTVLLRLDSTPFADRLSAARAQQTGLTRAAAEAKRDAERTQQLFDRTVASESEVQTALITQEKTAAALAQNQAQVHLRQWELAQSTLKAPFDARIISVQAAPGETISSESTPAPLITLARADLIDATVQVSPPVAAALSLGQTIPVKIGTTTAEGKLTALSTVEESGRTSYQLRVTLPAKAGWIAGLPAELTLP